MIEKLKKIADKYIELYQDNPTELQKYQLIRKILNQDNCFLNISVDYAYAILRDLDIREDEIKNIYMKLIDLSEKDV